MDSDYQKICLKLLAPLTEKQKEIIVRRFGLDGRERETLESIGKGFEVTRERVRQIQDGILEKVKLKLSPYQGIFQLFSDYLKKYGNLRKEDVLLTDLGGQTQQNEVYFLLSLKKPFQRWAGNDDFHPLWFINQNSLQLAKKTIDLLYKDLQRKNKPSLLAEMLPPFSLKKEFLISYLQISKKIQRNEEDFYGLKNWPEINPRGIKDKAYLVLKKIGKPIHFSQVANLIEGSHLETVHNELIRDARFVLVGRGIYGLTEWGYTPGQLKDIIFNVLKREERPLTKEEIIKKVLEQRFVKENSILMNLSNKKYFQRDSQGKYIINPEIA